MGMIRNIKKSLYFHFVNSFIAWHPKNTRRVIYLTFDDGPEPGITESILDDLKRYDAKATFFCCGKNIEKYPELYQKLLNHGHSIGNHTFSHLNSLDVNSKKYIEDIKQCEKLLGDNLPFRPPWGIVGIRALIALWRKKIVLWDVSSGDTKKSFDISELQHYWERKVRNNCIVLFHFSTEHQYNTCAILPIFLQLFSEKGFVFERI